MGIFNIVLYAVLIFMIFRIYILSKRQKKNKRLISIVNRVNQPEFFEECDDMIATVNDPEFENKTKVIRLWGSLYNKVYGKVSEQIDAIELDPMIDDSKGKNDIEANEDSFFYLYLAIPNMLYGAEKEEERKQLKEKMDTVNDRLGSQLVCLLSQACEKYYAEEDDRGQAFFEQILEGNYGEYRYSKSLISLYKMICGAMLAKLKGLDKDAEDYEENVSLVKKFQTLGVGLRWCKQIGLEILEDETEEDSQIEEFEMGNDNKE